MRTLVMCILVLALGGFANANEDTSKSDTASKSEQRSKSDADIQSEKTADIERENRQLRAEIENERLRNELADEVNPPAEED